MARETPSIFAMSVAVMPFSRSWRALAASASSTLRGRPPLRPFAAAAMQPGAGALDHGVAFELGEGGHDGEHGLAHRPFGVQTLGEAPEPDPAGSQLVDDSENVLGVASEAVELPDGEHVAFAEMVEAGVKLRVGRPSSR